MMHNVTFRRGKWLLLNVIVRILITTIATITIIVVIIIIAVIVVITCHAIEATGTHSPQGDVCTYEGGPPRVILLSAQGGSVRSGCIVAWFPSHATGVSLCKDPRLPEEPLPREDRPIRGAVCIYRPSPPIG